VQELKELGLRYGDRCTVISPARPKKTHALNRTAWDVVPEVDRGRLSSAAVISVPGAAARSFHWRLELATVLGEARYLLRTLDGAPFALNGQWSREAFVSDRDTLGIDHCLRLEFHRHRLQDELRATPWPAGLDDQAVRASQLPVLLQGETGTGKGFHAEEIHRASGRAGQFVALNLSALSSSLVESELFGHKRGAFTGATRDHDGALAAAHNGTLFLDEVDSLSKDLQLKLLHFLDSGSYRRVGDTRLRSTSARLIFAAGRSLEAVVKDNGMRADFYFRLHQGVVAELGPLRDSVESIRRHCLAFALEKNVTVAERLISFYQTLPWPGNVRQLRGHLAAKVARSSTRKLDFDLWDEKLLVLSSDLCGLSEAERPLRRMEEVKREYARYAYARCGRELAGTARELGVNKKTLKAWLGD